MSEPLLSPESINSPFQLTASASTSSDPASSLRAAALLTLKSKRRKPTTDQPISQSLPSRPPPLDTGFQLDYGTEEITASPLEQPAITPSHLTHMSSKSLVITPAEDVQMREEGEISDEETVPLPVRKPSLEIPKPRSPPRHSASIAHGRRSTPPRSAGPNIDATQPWTRLSDRIADPTSHSVSYDQDVASSPMAVDAPEILDGPPHLLDADHIRPGLASRCFSFRSRISISLYTSYSEPSTV